MKSYVRRLARARHAVYGALLQGVVALALGLVLQANKPSSMQISAVALVVIGAGSVVAAGVALVATYRVRPVLEGTIVDPRQPQLPDAQVNMHCAPELPQAA